MGTQVIHQPRRPSGGLTLIELLVVLVIIGIVISMAVLSAGDGGKGHKLELEARRVKALLGIAAQDAIYRSQQIGVAFNDNGYRFLVLDDGQWKPLTEDKTLRKRRVPDWIRLQLVVEGTQAVLGTHEKPKDKPVPEVMFSPAGEQTPFVLTLKLKDGRYFTVTGKFGGELVLKGPLHAEGA